MSLPDQPLGEVKAAAPSRRAGCVKRGTISLVTRPVSSVISSTTANQRADAVGSVDDDRDDGDAAAKLPEGVAVRGVVAVVAPDPADAGRAVGFGVAQGTDELGVQQSGGSGTVLLDHE